MDKKDKNKYNPISNTKLGKFTKKMSAFKKAYQEQETELKKYWLYNETVKDLEQAEIELFKTRKELEDLKRNFRNFYEKLQPKNLKEKIEDTESYTFNCDLNRSKLSDLYNELNSYFDCDLDDFINLFSENISVYIHIKNDVKITDVMRVFYFLFDEKIIKNKNWQSVIYNSECLIYKSKPLDIGQVQRACTNARNTHGKSEINIQL